MAADGAAIAAGSAAEVMYGPLQLQFALRERLRALTQADDDRQRFAVGLNLAAESGEAVRQVNVGQEWGEGDHTLAAGAVGLGAGGPQARAVGQAELDGVGQREDFAVVRRP